LRILTIVLLASSLAGCASWSFGEREKPVTVVTKPLDRTPLAIPDPEPLKTQPLRWSIITPDNAADIWARMEQDGRAVVLFALTDDGYQQLAMTIADLRRLIVTQRDILRRYREYYEPQKSTSTVP
jgi:hypothetical protein